MVLAAVLLAFEGGHAAGESGAAARKSLQPVRMKHAYALGKELDPLRPWPDTMLIKPIKTHRFTTWYTGEKLTVGVYDADDGKIQFTDLPYDEHVHLLHGTAILTSQDGTRHVFKAGDDFVAPKGWTGTWELKDGYRELITFETQSLAYAMKAWFNE
jgi:uncharacterized cupin superfamily protein